MQQVKRGKPTLEMVFKNQKQFSNNVYKRMLKALEELSEWCDKFEITDGQNATLLLNQVNHYYWDLASVIFNLQQILNDIGKDDPSSTKLKNVVVELNQFTASIQESLELEPGKLKLKLKATVVIAGFQVERLTKMIEFDGAHEYKQRILDCQLDLVIYTEKLKFGLQFCNLGFAEMEKCAHNFIDKTLSTLMKLKADPQDVEDDFAHYFRRNIQHIQYFVDYMTQLRNTGRFRESLDETFKNSDKSGKEFMDIILVALESGHPIQNFLENIAKGHQIIVSTTVEFQKAINDAAQKNYPAKVRQIIQEIMLYLFTGGLNIIHSLNKTLEDIIMKN